MSKLTTLTLVLASLFAMLACSGDGPTPAAQPTVEAAATHPPQATATPSAIPQPTATATPQLDSADTGQDKQPSGTQGLAPLNLNIDDPQAFLSALSVQEQSCLAINNIGTVEVLAAMTDTDASEEADAIIDCLEDRTVLRLFLNDFLIATGELRDETSECIRDGLGSMDLRRFMKSTGGQGESMDDQVAGLASLMTIMVCLSDDEWERATAVMGLGPRDKAGTDCLLMKLGGPTGVAEALLRAYYSGRPQEFIDAADKCGLGSVGMLEDVPVDASSIGIDSSTEGLGHPPDTLHPLTLEDLQAFLSELSPREQSCLDNNGVGPLELSQITEPSPGVSPDSAAAAVNCLQDETVLRLFLTTLIGQIEPFSQETSLCIREGFVPLDLRGLLAPAVAGFTPTNSLALGMAALNVSVACMNDDEWETYAPSLGMQPEDREDASCMFEELGGPAKLVEAMRDASYGEPPESFLMAAQTCGLEGTPSSQ